jgi:hypothetical protein
VVDIFLTPSETTHGTPSDSGFSPIPNKPGSTFGAHTISSITARIPKSVFGIKWPEKDVTLGAYYLSGYAKMESKIGQFHAQISLLQDPNPAENSGTAHRYMPDVVATANWQQLRGSKDHVVLVFAILGETEIHGKNGLTLNHKTSDPTCNVTLKWDITEMDLLTGSHGTNFAAIYREPWTVHTR